jgi:hypothetical protein
MRRISLFINLAQYAYDVYIDINARAITLMMQPHILPVGGIHIPSSHLTGFFYSAGIILEISSRDSIKVHWLFLT